MESIEMFDRQSKEQGDLNLIDPASFVSSQTEATIVNCELKIGKHGNHQN